MIIEKGYGFYEYPVIVFDQSLTTSQEKFPSRFRMISFFHAVGSGEFSKSQLIQVTKEINSPIYIVDLRQESHGFINEGIPISWRGSRNWLNKDLDVNEILTLESHLLKEQSSYHKILLIRKDKTKSTYFEKFDEEKGLWGNEETINIKKTFTEKELAIILGLNYQRIPVLDHFMPNDREVENFLHFYRQLPSDTWIYFHCHGGGGRTTTFLILLEILRNYQQQNFNKILMHQHEIGGSDLAHFNIVRPKWYTDAAQERLEFLKKFYDYVSSGNYSHGMKWINYKKNH